MSDNPNLIKIEKLIEEGYYVLATEQSDKIEPRSFLLGLSENQSDEYRSIIDLGKFNPWFAKSKNFLSTIFEKDHDYVTEFHNAAERGTPESVRNGISFLESLKEEVAEIVFDTKLYEQQIEKETDKIIFIGHGRSKLWARLQIHLQKELHLKTLVFEDESRTSGHIITILEEFLEKASYAILILTAEDETAEGQTRARQNVIHEAGLFQGRLGFNNVIILKQNGIEEFTNIAGLQYIPFTGDNIQETFYELGRKLRQVGLLQ